MSKKKKKKSPSENQTLHCFYQVPKISILSRHGENISLKRKKKKKPNKHADNLNFKSFHFFSLLFSHSFVRKESTHVDSALPVSEPQSLSSSSPPGPTLPHIAGGWGLDLTNRRRDRWEWKFFSRVQISSVSSPVRSVSEGLISDSERNN